jgi:hypothetical protein
MHHAGLHERDRRTVEELFVNCKIQVWPLHWLTKRLKMQIDWLTDNADGLTDWKTDWQCRWTDWLTDNGDWNAVE